MINTGYQSLAGTATVAGPFAVTAGTPYDVGVGQTQTVTVSFMLPSTGAFTNAVVFVSNGGSSTNTVIGVGVTSAQISVSQASLNFGTVATGSSSQSTFVVTNIGGTAATGGTATVNGGPSTIVSGSTFTLTAGASTNVVVQFAPLAAGGFTNSVIAATTNGGTSTNTVTGTGAVVPVASFTASPASGTEPLAVTFTDTSTGTAPLGLLWNLGDSTTTNTAGGAVFAHNYAAGTYTVTLTASNIVGSSTLVSNNLINVASVFQGWQLQYLGCTIRPQAQPGADPYGKGISNTNQFLLGLNPTNPASVFEVINAVPQGSDLLITWATAGGITNVVQSTAGLPGGSYATNFLDVSPLIVIQGSGDTRTNYLDAGAMTNSSSLFFRVRLQQ